MQPPTRVLLVDDNPTDRVLVTWQLARTEPALEIAEASSIAAAREALEHERFDCIVLDYHLADGTAEDIIRRVGNDCDSPPIVVLTGMGDEHIAAHCIKVGAKEYLSKHGMTGERLHESIASAIERRRLERSLREQQAHIDYLAHHDSLTGLLNRAAFTAAVESTVLRVRRNHMHLALLFIDLDRFKSVNDRFGHHAGDTVLAVVAERLRDNLRANDLIARLGGDEFAIAIESDDDQHRIAQIAEKLIRTIEAEIPLGEGVARISASVGIAISDCHRFGATEILRQADEAMFAAKRAGRNSYRFFTDRMNAEAQVRRDLSQSVDAALERDEFRVFYQPIVALESRRPIGREALLRWQHVRAGLVPPRVFLPLIEELGLLRAIGDWTIERACAERARWPQHGTDPSVLSINISASQLQEPTLGRTFADALARHGIERGWLQIEINEASLAGISDQAKRSLDELRALGVLIAIDNFGCGTASLAQLLEVPCDTIKIDRRFVPETAGETRASIVRAICAMSSEMHIRCIATGVESETQAGLLQTLGCRLAQGWALGRPRRDALAHTDDAADDDALRAATSDPVFAGATAQRPRRRPAHVTSPRMNGVGVAAHDSADRL